MKKKKKAKKKTIFYLAIPVIAFLLFYIIDYIYLNVSYLKNKDTFIETFAITGYQNGFVPQGITYSDKYDVVLQTSYSKKNHSMLFVYNYSDGKVLKKLTIKDSNSNDSHEHVGGITTDNEHVWISNDYVINEFSLEEILNTDEEFITSKKETHIINKGDFCYYKDNTLWIGESRIMGEKPLLLGFNQDDLENPLYALEIPYLVQGMSMLDDNSIILTTSFSNLLQSKILVYSNVLEQDTKEKVKVTNKEIPLYKLNKKNLIKKVKTSPMAEGIFYKDNYLHIIFENSSDEYEFTFPKIKKLVKYEI